MSAQIAYVLTKADNLQVNTWRQLCDRSSCRTTEVPQQVGSVVAPWVQDPFPDFGGGSTRANDWSQRLQRLANQARTAVLERTEFPRLPTHFRRPLRDAGDLLNGGSAEWPSRNPDVPGFGLRGDWSLASFNITNVFHFSGGYELPFGKDKHFLHDANKLANAVVGGWSINWIVTLQGGQPLDSQLPDRQQQPDTGCYDVSVPGQSQKLGIKVRPNANGHLTRSGSGTRPPSNSLASWSQARRTASYRFRILQPDAFH